MFSHEDSPEATMNSLIVSTGFENFPEASREMRGHAVLTYASIDGNSRSVSGVISLTANR